jgi:glycosyltransferase involved in cell wall biosynthesis
MQAGLDHVVYSGALGDKQNPDALLAFLADVRLRHPNVRCHVFSAGPYFKRLKTTYTIRGVDFHDLVKDEDLSELYARSSVQVIPQASGTSHGSLPSKLPNLLAAGVPIFAICDECSEISSILDASGAGAYATSFSSPELLSRFDSLLTSIASEAREHRKERLRDYVDSNFSIESFVDALLQA